jgi:hypothetical protein
MSYLGQSSPLYQSNQLGSNNPLGSTNQQLIGGCESTQYGCCTDEKTAKIDSLGSNCPDCLDLQDFGSYCNNLIPNSGVKSISSCGKDKYKVECDIGYIGTINYGNDKVITPCLDKALDLNEMCRYYNNKPIPNGYNVNSIAASTILPGFLGDCYTNKIPDNNKVRALCDYNHLSTVKKLSNINNSSNIFTDCLPTNTNFQLECQNLLNNDINSKAVEIMGYDCLPGYTRAKCFNSDKYEKNNQNLLDSIYSPNNSVNTNNSNNNCPCT